MSKESDLVQLKLNLPNRGELVDEDFEKNFKRDLWVESLENCFSTLLPAVLLLQASPGKCVPSEHSLTPPTDGISCVVHNAVSTSSPSDLWEPSSFNFLLLISVCHVLSDFSRSVRRRLPKKTEYLWWPVSSSSSAPAPTRVCCPRCSSTPPATELWAPTWWTTNSFFSKSAVTST